MRECGGGCYLRCLLLLSKGVLLSRQPLQLPFLDRCRCYMVWPTIGHAKSEGANLGPSRT